jgi:hypothetical protein
LLEQVRQEQYLHGQVLTLHARASNILSMSNEPQNDNPTDEQQVSESPDQPKNEAAKALSSLGASKGGRARATLLTPEQRKAISRKAIQTRWAKAKGISLDQQEQVSESPDQPEDEQPIVAGDGLPIALFPGKLQIGAEKFAVYVLDNQKRVMVQREVVRALTGNVKGGLERYLEATNLQEFLNKEEILSQTIKFRIPGTQFTATGYEATLLIEICDAYLRAREADVLAESQEDLAKQAEIILRASAKVGIIALIDEATGYTVYKKKQEYQLKLQAFIADELQDWAQMFPDEFWFELARLEGVHYSPRSRPLRWGKYVMMFVYDAVDGDVGKELRKKNPDPHFLKNHHQWLKKFGRDKVHDQITRVITIMKLCHDMNEFRQKFSKLFKKTNQMQFGFSLTQ